MNAEPTPAAQSNTSEFTRLLEYLKVSRGFDFGAYKVSSLMRRVQKRMREVGAQSYSEYSDYLEVHPDEFGAAVQHDPHQRHRVLPRSGGLGVSWRASILPRIERARAGRQPIRVWSAGCASGEEAYTLAMLLAEALGEEAFRERVKIYATDVDEEALDQARQADYAERERRATSRRSCWRGTSSRPGDRAASSARTCAAAVIFGRHDLIQDAPISRARPAGLPQHADVLQRRDAGADPRPLPLRARRQRLPVPGQGRDAAHPRNASFTPVDLKRRVFSQACRRTTLRDRLLALAAAPAAADADSRLRRDLRLREAAFDAGPVAQIVVDRRGLLVAGQRAARALFSLASARPRPAAPGPRALLPPGRAALAASNRRRRAPRRSALKDVEWRAPERASRG